MNSLDTGSPSRSRLANSRDAVGRFMESKFVGHFIIAVILLNAVILGLDTSPAITAQYGAALITADKICLGIFIVELLLKLFAQGVKFFTKPWNIFDTLIVGIALMPGSGSLAVLRALRVVRVFRLISVMPKLRFVVEALMSAVPGMLSIGALLAVVFYVSGVMAATLFGETFPQWFGGLPASLYTLFQIMTLESWSMGIVRPVMEKHWWAPAFFVPFILLSSFTVLNLFIAVIVDSMQTIHLAEKPDEDTNPASDDTDYSSDEKPCEAPPLDRQAILEQLDALEKQVTTLKESLRS